MATKGKEVQENKKIVWTSCPDDASRVCVQYSPVCQLQYECTENADGVKEYMVFSDVSLLFNQKRLENLGVDTARDWLNGVQNRLSQPLKEAPNLTDDELMNFVKSKHIQSPSELLSWSKYLDAEVAAIKQQSEDEKTFKSNLARLKARLFGEEKEKTEKSE